MKAFRFRPAALLDLRRRERDTAQANLARARLAADAAESASREADEGCTEAIGRYRASLGGAFLIGTVQWHRNWIVHQRAASAALRLEANQYQEAVAGAAGLLRAAHQRVRVLERLRDRKRARHDEAERRQDGKEMDQLGALQHCYREERDR